MSQTFLIASYIHSLAHASDALALPRDLLTSLSGDFRLVLNLRVAVGFFQTLTMPLNGLLAHCLILNSRESAPSYSHILNAYRKE